MRNMQGLVSFVEAAAHGSFTAAAARLELSPAAVSKNVARLESELGVRLFNRTTRRLNLTAEGAAFAEQARNALRALDEAVAGVTRAGGDAAGRVRISVGVAFGRRYVQPLLPTLAAQHPLLELDLSLDNRPVDLVAEGFDIGVRGGVLVDSSLVARRVCKLPVVLVASTRYLRRHGVPHTVDQLSQHQLLGVRLSSGQLGVWRMRRPSGRGWVEYQPAARVWTNDPESLIDLALADAGICQTGLCHVLPALQAGTQKVVMPEVHDSGDREIALHYPHRQFLPARVRVVVDGLLAHLAQAPLLHVSPQQLLPAWLAAAVTPRRKTAGTLRSGPAGSR